MPWEGEERDAEPTAGSPPPPPPAATSLRPVPDSGRRGACGPADPVRLVREWKGPTVGEVLRDDQLSAALPGRAVRALSAISRGELAAADAALPGHFERVLVGPWRHQQRSRHLLLLVLALILVLGVAAALVSA